MKLELTYVFHNCFLLCFSQFKAVNTNLTLLFDYPANSFLEQKQRTLVKTKITGTNLYIISSHCHEDHFNPDLANLLKTNPEGKVILSHDIIEAGHGEFNLAGQSQTADNPLLIAEPSETYELPDFTLTTFPSNDSGLAYLLNFRGIKLYFGGDLADWDWEGELGPEERARIKRIFHSTIERLKQEKIHIAFTNTDRRLKNWAGASEFIAEVRPEIFIPMHTFGDTQSLRRFFQEYQGPLGKVFQYQNAGDSISFHFSEP